jgi:hypothetical protein
MDNKMKMDLLEYTPKVINSCKTLPQLEVAKRYAYLANQAIFGKQVAFYIELQIQKYLLNKVWSVDEPDI